MIRFFNLPPVPRDGIGRLREATVGFFVDLITTPLLCDGALTKEKSRAQYLIVPICGDYFKNSFFCP